MEVVKRKGHKEKYDQRKLYASIYAACLSVRVTDEEAEHLAAAVVREIEAGHKDQSEVSSTHLRKAASEILHRYHPEAAYIYLTHRDIS